DRHPTLDIGDGPPGARGGRRLGPPLEFDHRHRAAPANEKNSARDLGSSRNKPWSAEVTVSAPCASTPRSDMQRCSACTTTPTPFGSRCSVNQSATCLVSRS